MNKNYILNIEGYSERMTDEARERLLQWRDRALQHANRHKELVYLNGPDVPKVALTFDDGPDDRITPMIAETLSRYGVKGSFFFIGSRARQYPEVVKAVYEAGHLVFGHSYDHDRLTTLDKDSLDRNFQQTQAVIRDIIGKEPAMFRPPFGDADEAVFQAARLAGCSTVLWSLDTLDWSQKEEAHIRRNVETFVRNGEIVLMHSHSGCIETAKALPQMIETLQRKRMRVVGLEELLDAPAYRS
ncbi:polysaccharide deacetylase family protein [Paenibacillus mesophilus]|uniref:polysaccharide deacetylase family protein n=1 Tax=Paenibacillus mesophilus TaxID=2582849 RepID=UPI00110F2117|nr:polysaccharide deacetylase family protein [Paenibacillus mesophilus]TMV43463.1 polysaccharide deacetylase family protein [Paenibacillus mesophilus]